MEQDGEQGLEADNEAGLDEPDGDNRQASPALTFCGGPRQDAALRNALERRGTAR